ncbi:MAG TPA: TonB-dependent receptor plug domain-containing protein, partial [Anaeromyxobacteraceae bacterium]|nr:TonB-dependent receptor plug domain-containing protein [Anaeromyxobacteraceae bacterium]
MDPRSRLALGAFALALVFAGVVRAEDPAAAGAPSASPAGGSPAPDQGAPPVTLPEVEIRLPASEATADPTAAVTVVPAERYAGEAKQVAELVATAPGVAVSAYGGLGQLATASIRGSTPDAVRVLLDGLPLNTAFGGGVDLSTIPRQWISRLEVVRGPEGALYGAGAMGGALNVVTRPAAAGTWSAEATGGSFGTWSGAADAAFGRPGLDVLAAVNAERTGGGFTYRYDRTPNVAGGEQTLVRENNGAARAGGLVKLGAALGGDLRLDGLAQVSGG